MSAKDIGANYAGAFIESLRTPEDVQRGSQDLETFSALLVELPSLVRVLEHPGLALARREEILDVVLDKIDAHPISRSLLHLIVEKGRLGHIKSIATEFAKLRDERLKVASAEVVTATPLDRASRVRWEKLLARLTGKEVRVTYRTDGNLLGGAVTRIDSTVYDGSVRKQLARIRGVLLGEQREQTETRS